MQHNEYLRSIDSSVFWNTIAENAYLWLSCRSLLSWNENKVDVEVDDDISDAGRWLNKRERTRLFPSNAPFAFRCTQLMALLHAIRTKNQNAIRTKNQNSQETLMAQVVRGIGLKRLNPSWEDSTLCVDKVFPTFTFFNFFSCSYIFFCYSYCYLYWFWVYLYSNCICLYPTFIFLYFPTSTSTCYTFIWFCL